MSAVHAFPATSRQRWYVDADRAAWSALNVPVVADIADCDEPVLRAVLHDLVLRHDALRTTLTGSGAEVVQQVHPDAVPVLQVEDLPGGEDAAVLQRRVLAVLDEPFRVRGGALVRARLLRVTAHRSVLVVSCHHAICDGWSAGILFRDLAELYRARRRDRMPRLPELALQFPDYAVWEWAARSEEPSAHWRSRLGAGHPRLRVGDRQAADTGPGHFCSFPLPELPAAAGAALGRLAAAHRTTAARVVTAAAAASLVPLVGPRMTIGVFAGNREQPELLDVVGDLADRLPVVVDTSTDPTFGELVDRVDREVADAMEHWTPMAALAPLIRQDPDRVAGPLLDVTVNYLPHRTQTNPARDPDGAPEMTELATALEQRSFRADRWRDGFGLVDLQFRPRPDGGIGGYLLANASVLSPAVARRIAATTTAALARLVADPDRRIGALTGAGSP